MDEGAPGGIVTTEDEDDWFTPAALIDSLERAVWRMFDGVQEFDGYPYAIVDAGDIDVVGTIIVQDLRRALNQAGLDVPLRGDWKRLAAESAAAREAAEAQDAESAEPERKSVIDRLKANPTEVATSPRADIPAQTSPDGDTAMYRWFDADGVLVYVGISRHLHLRTRSHIKASDWMAFVASSTIERLTDPVEAAAAEEAAIKAERPIFNKVHNDTPQARRRAVEYLIQRDRLDLLAPAVSRG
jgi:hypothetical protein